MDLVLQENIKMEWKYKEKWHIVRLIVNTKEAFLGRNFLVMEN